MSSLGAPNIVVDAGAQVPNRDQVRQLRARTRRAARAMGIPANAINEIVLRVCDDAAIAGLKHDFFGIRQVTDVLSFPDPSHDGRGDIALCWPTTLRQAAARRIGVMHEASILVVHALAHLMGHDHLSRGQGLRMHRAEQRGLRALRVPDLRRSYGCNPDHTHERRLA